MRFSLYISILVMILAVNPAAQAVEHSVWEKLYGGSGLSEAFGVEETPDGGCIAAGCINPLESGGSLDFLLLKTDDQGVEQWRKTFGGPQDDVARSVKRTADGGYIVAGWTASFGAGAFDAWLIKTDASGEAEWSRFYGGALWDLAMDVHQTPDGGYIFAGETWEFVGGGQASHGFVVKTDAEGNEEWRSVIGGIRRDLYFAITPLADGGYAAAGYTISYSSTNNVRDYFLVKLDSDGAMVWRRNIDGKGGDDWGRDVLENPDGSLIMVGASRSRDGSDFDLCVIKTDSEGQLLWKKLFGIEDNAWGRAVIASDDGWIVSGKIDYRGDDMSDLYLLGIGPDGEQRWVIRNENRNTDEEAITVSEASGGAFLVGGSRRLTPVRGDLLLMKIDRSSPVKQTGAVLPDTWRLEPNHPNPFNPETVIRFSLPGRSRIRVTVVDILGRTVGVLAEGVRSAGNHTLRFDGMNLPGGVYTCRLEAGGRLLTRKMVLIK